MVLSSSKGGRRVLGRGYNSCRNQPEVVKNLKGKCTTHAEIAALKSARGSVQGATIYVARISYDMKTPMMSKPCPDCQKALKEAGIKKVFYTIDSEMDLS